MQSSSNPLSTVIPLLSLPQGLFISSTFKEGRECNLERMMVSVLHKELEWKEKKIKCMKLGGHAAKDKEIK